MTIAIFDRRRIAAMRRRAAAALLAGADTSPDFLIARAAGDLAERLAAVTRSFPLALDLGGLSGAVGDALRESGKVGTVIRADALAASPLSGGPDVVLDAEVLPFAPARFDLVVSLLVASVVNDLPGLLIQARRIMAPDGLLLAALLGGNTLGELREVLLAAEAEEAGGAGLRVAPFLDLRDAGALLQRAGFALPVADTESITVRYDGLGRLLADLRAMGATGVLAARPGRALTRASLARAAALYAERHSDPDGRIRATFELVWISGWAPHESQQRPLRPGSARTRLADALGTTERPA